MSIGTYSELQTAVGNWLNRSSLTARIPEFIALAEARFRRRLDDVDQDASATVTLTNGVGSLPANFGEMRSVADSTYGRVEYVSPEQFADYDSTDTGEYPLVYTIIGSQIKTLPLTTGAVSIVYKLGIPALSTSNTTNWLLTRAPDLYLFGALIHAEFFGWNDERLPTLKAAVDEMLLELNIDGEHRRYGSAPLGPRISRP